MKHVYNFTEGSQHMKELLGVKGATLSELTKLGLAIPEGFVVTTDACSLYYTNNKKINKDLKEEIFTNIEYLENTVERNLVMLKSFIYIS